MAELDAIVVECRGHGPFANGSVKDTSNRSNRDWPWWSVEIERTQEDGPDKRRTQAEIILNSPAPGVPSAFEARWLVRIWQGVSTDSFRQGERWTLAWDKPTRKDFEETMIALFAAADQAVPKT
jgi:hypothetical protein